MLSIIIVNWNVKGLLKQCLFSINKHISHFPFEVIVIDNDSSDGSKEMLKKMISHFSFLRVVFNKKNYGFAHANNQGIKLAKGKYLLFLNPDTVFTNNPFPQIFDFLKREDNLGALGIRLIYPDHTNQPTVKNDPTFLSQAFILLKLHHFFQPSFLNNYLAKKFDYSREATVKQIMGAFVFTTKEVMEKVGGWSEDYFLWWEDIDLCYRIRKAGYVIKYLPLGPLIHFEGKSFFQKLSKEKQRMFNKSLIIFWKKYHSFLEVIFLRLLFPVSLFLAFLVQTFRIKPKTQSKI